MKYICLDVGIPLLPFEIKKCIEDIEQFWELKETFSKLRKPCQTGHHNEDHVGNDVAIYMQNQTCSTPFNPVLVPFTLYSWNALCSGV